MNEVIQKEPHETAVRIAQKNQVLRWHSEDAGGLACLTHTPLS
jgi:hypothetical protein